MSDLLKVKWVDINRQEGSLYVCTQKTGIHADLPLPDVVLAHLDRLEQRGDRIFRTTTREIHRYVRKLKKYAKLSDFKGFHDIRRTACSEADRVRPGMGKVLMLHAPTNVTERSYLNALPELREVVEKMEVPDSFRHGIKMAIRAVDSAKKAVSLRPHDFATPIHPAKELFGFFKTGFSISGRFFAASPARTTVVKTLIENECVCSQPQLWAALYDTPFPFDRVKTERLQLHRDLSSTRLFLKRILGLPDGFNPITPTLLHRSREKQLCQYELFLPPAVLEAPFIKKQKSRVSRTGKGKRVLEGMNPANWRFSHRQFAYRGKWFKLRSRLLWSLLKVLCERGEPVGSSELSKLLATLRDPHDKRYKRVSELAPNRLANLIYELRRVLRGYMQLNDWDPIPCIKGAHGTAWFVKLPEDWQPADAS